MNKLITEAHDRALEKFESEMEISLPAYIELSYYRHCKRDQGNVFLELYTDVWKRHSRVIGIHRISELGRHRQVFIEVKKTLEVVDVPHSC